MLTVATSSERDKQRGRERRARQRRAAKLQQMRHLCDALECAAVVSHTLDDADAMWEDFLDDRALRVRRFLRGSTQLAKEAEDLQLERALLCRLLEEHRLSARAFSETLKEHPVDDWELKVAWWREVSRTCYVPWTLDECKAEMEAAVKEVNKFDWSLANETTGVSFLGWREKRFVDKARNAFLFQFHKTYRGCNMMTSVNVGWDMFTEHKTFHEILVGHHALCFHEVLQQLGPNIVIVWGVQRVPHINIDTHMTFLICRVQTERGILQCIRSIVCPELVATVAGPVDMWASMSMWKQWTRLEAEENGYAYRLGGSIVGKDATYLNHWMIAIFGCVLRNERVSTGRRLIPNE